MLTGQVSKAFCPWLRCFEVLLFLLSGAVQAADPVAPQIVVEYYGAYQKSCMTLSTQNIGNYGSMVY